jgi:hypothetical protein
MRIAPIVVLAAALAGWFVLSQKRQRSRFDARGRSLAEVDASLNAGERLQRTHAGGLFANAGNSVVDGDDNSDRLAVLGGEPPRSDRIIPGLPDYLRGG